jgi:nitrite reductase/ring-hydroxylating ferredoxin subunit
MAEHHTPEKRRSFLKLLTGGLGAVIGVIAAIPGLKFLAHPLVKETVTGGDEPLRVAMKDEVEVDRPKRVNVVGDIKAYSTVCPHLGCGIDWNDATKHFDCPCHGSVFDKEGKCIEGPSPRGMDELDVIASGDDIKVRYRRFRVSIPNKEPIG